MFDDNERLDWTIAGLRAQATLIGTVAGVEFYEDPKWGDEVSLIALVNGVVYRTGEFDLPTEDDVDEALRDAGIEVAS